MRIPLYQVDAFASRAFEGNPAAVCPLTGWLDDEVMQAVAEENNLSETAFFVPAGRGFELRWFTPRREIDLCGHATLAAAHVLFEQRGQEGRDGRILFATRSGQLAVERQGDLLRMDFPSLPPAPCPTPELLSTGLGGQRPREVLAADDLIAVFDSEAAVRAIRPDFAILEQLERRGVVVTAPGTDHDFVSRFFAPKYGIPEDPVTGSSHCQLAPYWAGRLGKADLLARQVSKRGGEILCEVRGDRVGLAGRAVTVLEGKLEF